MQAKQLIYIFLVIFSLIGGWLGSLIDHGNIFSIWSLLLSTLGAFIGIWAGYKINQSI
jgi:positive regulator of sigma E activity